MIALINTNRDQSIDYMSSTYHIYKRRLTFLEVKESEILLIFTLRTWYLNIIELHSNQVVPAWNCMRCLFFQTAYEDVRRLFDGLIQCYRRIFPVQIWFTHNFIYKFSPMHQFRIIRNGYYAAFLTLKAILNNVYLIIILTFPEMSIE